jgi:hypothetical protein
MNTNEVYKGYVIAWQEPPVTGLIWAASIRSNDPVLYAKMGKHGAQVIDGRTRDVMIAKAKEYIDGLGV